MGIYKRKQVSKKTRTRPRKRPRKKEKNFLFFLITFLVEFLFSFINSHLSFKLNTRDQKRILMKMRVNHVKKHLESIVYFECTKFRTSISTFARMRVSSIDSCDCGMRCTCPLCQMPLQPSETSQRIVGSLPGRSQLAQIETKT